MINFSREQIRAIEYRGDKSAAVSASAGSGKTAVLVEHIAYLISDKNNPVYADRIAAVTFTEKAAAELRQRLEKKIEELVNSNPDDEFLREQAVRLSSARISTISSFCLSLIRDNIRLLPLEEGFTICDDTMSQKLSDKAMKKLFEHIYKKLSDKKRGDIERRLGNESSISDSVLKLHSFLSNIPSGDDWIREQNKIYGDPILYSEKYAEPICKTCNRLALKAQKLFDSAIRIIETGFEEPDPKSEEKLKKYYGELSGRASGIFEKLADKDFTNAKKILGNEISRAPSIKNILPLSKNKLEKIKAELKEMTDTAKGYCAVLTNAQKDRTECADAFAALCELENIYDREYTRLKRKEGAADFSDLERYALEAVKLGGCKGVFDYIIVDEFQDSNDIQYEIFRLLSKEERNLYFVGDVKQCIYLFRSANPEIFASLPSLPNFEDLRLNTNYRSGENVISTVNMIFGGNTDMPESFSGGAWQDMKAGRGIAACGDNESELDIISYERGTGQSGIELEAVHIANRIIEMVQSGYKVNEGDKIRPCSYGDFAVLARTNSTVAAVRKILEDRGIPCVSKGDKAFTSLIETELALALLSAVLRPGDDTSVTAALMSPVYCFSAEDMANIKLIGNSLPNESEKISLYGSLSKIAEGGYGNAADELKEKINRFLADMRLFRKKAVNSLSHELMSEIFAVTDLPVIMSVGKRGRERLENLRLLLYYARSCPKPSDFLAVMKNISRNKLEMPQAQVKEQEEISVKLMTAHASKGLQFPIVFICGVNSLPSKKDASQSFIFDKDKGVGIMLNDFTLSVRSNTASHSALEESNRDKALGEQLRLLYVAMTRAEQKLIVTTNYALSKKNVEEGDDELDSLGFKGSYLKFICSRIAANPDSFCVQRISANEIISVQVSESSQGASGINIDKDEIRRRIAFKYPYEKAVITPAKLTATAIGINAEGMDSSDGESTDVSAAFYMGLPVFMKKGRPLTPKERGDIYHKVMQLIDFSSDNAEKELSRLLENRAVTEDERNAVESSEIQSFLDSPLSKRAAKADEVHREFPVFTTVNLIGGENVSQEDLSFIQGIADMFFVENGEIVLVDYKTNRNITAERLADEYRGQLGIYAQTLEEMTGMRVKEKVLFSFSLGRCISVE